MITGDQYFQAKPHTPEHAAAAFDLLERVNALVDVYAAALTSARFAEARELCPNTGTEISGSKGGAGDGGFRLGTSTTGSGKSSHKEGKGVDKYDPKNALDAWLDTFEDGKGGNSKLEEHGLYREHPDDTHGWCHLTTRRPGSGHRTFKP